MATCRQSSAARARPELVSATIASVLKRQAEGALDLDLEELDGPDQLPAAHDTLADGRGATEYVVDLERRH